MHQRIALCAVIVLAVSGCTSQRTQPTLAVLLNANGTQSTATFSAFVVLQAADCASNMNFLLMFQRPPIARSITLSHAWVVGTANGVDSISKSLESRGMMGITVHRATHTMTTALKMLGVHRTPLLIVVDQGGAVRYVSGSPTSPVEYVGLAQSLSALTPHIP